MVKFEYKQQWLYRDDNNIPTLNRAGEQGWEAVCCIYRKDLLSIILFKRPIKQKK